MLKMTDSSPTPTIHRLRGVTLILAIAGTLFSASPALAQQAEPAERSAWEIEGDAAERNRFASERRRTEILNRRRQLENLRARDPNSLTDGERRQMENLERTLQQLEATEAAAGGFRQGNAGMPGVRQDGAMGFQIENPDEMINLDFTEPVALSALIDFVARTLQINITISGNVPDDTITFKAPVQIRAGDLPMLLSTLLGDRGAAIVKGDLGLYRVVPGDRVPIEVGVDGLATTRIVPTPLIRPSSLQQVLTETFTGGNIRISPVDELGIIILTGGASQLGQAERFIGRIVDERALLRLHRLPIRNVSADFARQRIIDLDGVVNQIAAPRPGGGQQQPQAAGGSLTNLGSFLYVDAGNALLFRGSERDFQRVVELAEVVDIVSPLIARRYVAGSMVLQVAKAGEQLGMGPISSADEGAAAFTPGGLTRGAVGGGGQQPAPSQFGSSRFVVDPESGTFVYHGTPEQQERVKELVDDFRAQAIDTGIEIRIYKLTYASASGDSAAGGAGAGAGTQRGGGGGALSLGGRNTTQATGPGVAELLESLINEDQQTTGRFLPGGGGGAGAQVVNTDVINEILAEPEPDLRALDDVLSSDGGTRLSATSANTRIVADPSRNQLIIRAPVRVHEQLSRIIDQLDRPRPQVLVEVRIVSLTTTDDFEFSADVQVQAGQFSFLSALGVTTPGTTIESPVTVGAATRSGLTAAVIKSDFVPIAINALQRIGDARIVSTPQILVNDNQEGNIRSVREEPTEVTNQQTGVPAQTSQGPSVEAGTELVVRPQIAGDGSVVLNFAIEVSSFDTAARRGNLTPPKQTEAYNSVVSVPSNSTIIVGGFRFEELGKSILKIPILGDIPLVGELFRSTNTRDQSRIIYVFITPTVISETGQRDLRLLTDGPLRDADIREGLPSLRPAMVPLSSIRIDQIRPDLDLGAGVDQGRPARSTSRARTDWD